MRGTLLLVCLLGMGMATAYADESMTFLRAISLLAGEQKAPAYALLENIYTHSKSEEERARAALLLAYANNQELKIQKRHRYAEYCLEHPVGDAARADSNSLLRIAGDGYFDEGDLELAEKHYLKLASGKDSANVDYAEYKLGWIDLNREEPLSAFRRFQRRLVATGSGEHFLRDSLVRDLGRAWAETMPPTDEQSETINKLSFSSADAARLTDGIVSGLRRLKKPAQVSDLRAALFKTEYATPVFSRMLSQAVALPADPCSVLDWMEGPVAMDRLNAKESMASLNHCFTKLKADHPHDWHTTQTRDRLVLASRKVRAVALERWMRAEFYRNVGDNGLSCLEFISMGREHFNATRSELPPEAREGMVLACQSYAQAGQQPNANQDEEIAQNLIGLLESYAGAGLLGQDQKAPIYALVINCQDKSVFREALLETVLRQPVLFRKSLLPSMVVASLKTDEQMKMGKALLDQYGPRPIETDTALDQVWLELLRAQLKGLLDEKKFVEGRLLLTTYIPMSAEIFKRKTPAELWMFWALAAPSSEFGEAGKQIAREFLHALTKDTPKEKRDIALGVAMKFDEVDSVWAAWQSHTLEQVGEEKILSQFYQRTYSLLLDRKLDVACVAANPIGKSLVWASELSRRGSIDRDEARILKKTDLGLSEGAAPAFMGDLRKVAELGAEGGDGAKNKLVLNSKLTKRIEARFTSLNAQFESLKSKIWSHPLLARMARSTVGENCAHFVTDLEKLGGQSETLRSSLDSVTGLVKSWRKTLIADVTPQEGAGPNASRLAPKEKHP